MAADSPAFTEADAAAFSRLLGAGPAHVDGDAVRLDGQVPGEPTPPDPPVEDPHDHGGHPAHTIVAVTVVRGEHQAQASAVLHEPLAPGELERAGRACVAGAIAQIAAHNASGAG